MNIERFDKIFNTLKPSQVYEELLETIRIVEELKPKIILEVGVFRGGTLAYWYDIIPEDGLIIAIEPLLDQSVINMFPRDYKELVFIPKLSQNAVNTLRKVVVEGNIDFIFIDGDHERMLEDYQLFFPFLRDGGLMGIHDFKKWGNKTRIQIQKDNWYTYFNEGDTWGTAYVWKKTINQN